MVGHRSRKKDKSNSFFSLFHSVNHEADTIFGCSTLLICDGDKQANELATCY